MFEMIDDTTTRIFLTNSSGMEDADRPLPLILPFYLTPLAPGQEQLRVLLISSPTWVTETIHDLHARGFANTTDWSSLLPGANPDEVVSILTRRRQRRGRESG
jgi:hypothetical protein